MASLLICNGRVRKMEPTREKKVTLVDLLDRALNKGVLINADIIITIADVPLIGLNLRAALAGVQTMLDYGMMNDWDEALRAIAREERKIEKIKVLVRKAK